MQTRGGNTQTHQIHPVTRTGHQTNVANGIKRAQLIERQALVHEMDGHELHRSEPAVDPADELVHRRTQVLVLLDVLTRGNGQLRENDLS